MKTAQPLEQAAGTNNAEPNGIADHDATRLPLATAPARISPAGVGRLMIEGVELDVAAVLCQEGRKVVRAASPHGIQQG